MLCCRCHLRILSRAPRVPMQASDRKTHSRKWLTCAALGIAAAAGAMSSAFGQQSAPPLVDQARDRAMQGLIDATLRLDVVVGQYQQTVASMLAMSMAAEREWRATVAEAAQYRPLPSTSSATAEVEASVPTATLEEALRRIAGRHLSTAAKVAIAFKPSPGPAVFASGRALADPEPRDPRPGWRFCTSHEIEIVQAAAQYDLRQRIVDYAYRIPVNDKVTLASVFRRHPKLDQALRSRIETVPVDEPVFEPAGLCVVSRTMSGTQLGALMQQALADSGESIGVSFMVLAEKAWPKPMLLEGFAVAPPASDAPLWPTQGATASRPAWANQFITAKAAGREPAGVADAKLRRELAIKTATIEARRQLWVEMEKLIFSEGDTLADRVAGRSDRVDVIRALNDAVFELAKPSVDASGVATVNLGIRLETVWRTVGE